MFGKGALIFVAGFSLVFGMYQAKLNRLAVSASDNFNYHYMNSFVHEASMTAMNFAINDVWANDTDSTNFSVYQAPCSSAVIIRPIGSDTIKVKVTTKGKVFIDDYYEKHSSLFTMVDSIMAYFSYQIPMSKYFWFTNNEGNVFWFEGDTVWGPIHTNKNLKTWGNAVFYGKVTARRGITPDPSSAANQADYFGGWEVGVDAAVPTDMTHLVSAAQTGNGGIPGLGGAAYNTMSLYNAELELEFFSNGTVRRDVSGTVDTVAVATIAPTGVIHCTEDVHVSGTFNGELTIYSEDDVWIDDDIVYADDPLVNSSSDDILGLVAVDDIIVTDNAANNSDCEIQACIMSIGGSFQAEDHNTRGIAGDLEVTGSIVQHQRGPVGTFNAGTGMMTNGFSKKYYYDPRLVGLSPPNYPYVRSLRLVSWWE